MHMHGLMGMHLQLERQPCWVVHKRQGVFHVTCTLLLMCILLLLRQSSNVTADDDHCQHYAKYEEK